MIGLKLKEYFANQGISQVEVAEKTGTSKSYINGLFSGRTKFGKEAAAKWENIFGFSQSWLLTGEGPMLKSESSASPQQADEPKTKLMFYPGVTASMGDVSFIDDPCERRIPLYVPGFEDCTVALLAFGDSMTPTITSGNIVIMKEWTASYVEWGQIYMVVTREGYRTIKRIYDTPEGDSVECRSDNTQNTPFKIPKADILRLFVVKGWIVRAGL